MSETMSVKQNRDGYGEIRMDSEMLTQPSAQVPLLDWPADLFTSDAAIVDIIAEDCSFRYDSPAMWYGNHMPEMHA